jgi:hypothetical protein
MLRPTCKSRDSSMWALGLRREMQIAIGQQLRIECELPKELAPELSMLLARLHEDRLIPPSRVHRVVTEPSGGN